MHLTSCSLTAGKFKVKMLDKKSLELTSPPSFLTPLKRRTAPQGYECCMSCAVKGDPTPRVTWYHNNISLNTNTNYYITNVCGVCSLIILRTGPKDNGEYKVVIENQLGKDECSMMLNVKGINTSKGVQPFPIMQMNQHVCVSLQSEEQQLLHKT